LPGGGGKSHSWEHRLREPRNWERCIQDKNLQQLSWLVWFEDNNFSIDWSHLVYYLGSHCRYFFFWVSASRNPKNVPKLSKPSVLSCLSKKAWSFKQSLTISMTILNGRLRKIEDFEEKWFRYFFFFVDDEKTLTRIDCDIELKNTFFWSSTYFYLFWRKWTLDKSMCNAFPNLSLKLCLQFTVNLLYPCSLLL